MCGKGGGGRYCSEKIEKLQKEQLSEEETKIIEEKLNETLVEEQIKTTFIYIV